MGGSHRGLGNGGCCEVGEPARVLFDATARDDQHRYSDRSLRGTGRGSSRAASGGPPPLEIRGTGGWDTPGFFLGGSCYTLVSAETKLVLNGDFCLQADREASLGWAGASGLFWTAIWRVAASFSDRGGTQNSDLGAHLMRQHLSVAGLTASCQRLAGPGDVQ